MTTEDLILGHFDGTLSPEHEARLQTELTASSDVRSLYEQHRSLHVLLDSDAASLAPSSRLDDAVVAAALSAVPEAIGGGALSWLTAKVVGISTVVVGGLSIAFLVGSGADDAEKPVPQMVKPAPVVRTVPVAPEPTAPRVTEESPEAETSVVEQPAATKTAAPSRAGQRGERPATRPQEMPDRRPTLDFGKEDPTLIEGETIISTAEPKKTD